MTELSRLEPITTPVPTPLRKGSPEIPFVGTRMPGRMLTFIWRVSAWDQVWLALIAIAVALLGLVPIEFQRRIVNEAIKHKNWDPIWSLALIYAGLVVAHGLMKLLFNLYKGWVGANAVRLLRIAIGKLTHGEDADEAAAAHAKGVEISMIVSECDAIGQFVGDALTEPVLEGGILLAVFGYMFFLQPVMALVSLAIFIPQAVFVPLFQRAINRKVQSRVKTLRKAGADVLTDETDASRSQTHEARFRKVFRLDFAIIALKNNLNFLMNLFRHVGTVVIVVVGAWLVLQGQTQVGTVVAFLSGLSSIIDPWNAIVGWFQNYWVTAAKYTLVRDAVAKLQVAETDGGTAGQGGGQSPRLEAAEGPA